MTARMANDDILLFSPNRFGGVVVDAAALPSGPAEFERRLGASLAAWGADGFKVVWLELPLAKSALLPAAARAGFEYHHAKDGADGGALMTLRLAAGAYVPPFATHYVGAGAAVVNERDEILVVSERYRMGGGRGPGYKLPGGALHPGEHLARAAEREVLEETGVRARFEALACFRHWHGYRYGKSDIYFVCRLSALSTEITMQEEEIAECLWMPLDDFLSEESGIHVFNQSIVRAALEHPGMAPAHIAGYDDHERFEFFMPAKPRKERT